jgi:hypothetical protein
MTKSFNNQELMMIGPKSLSQPLFFYNREAPLIRNVIRRSPASTTHIIILINWCIVNFFHLWHKDTGLKAEVVQAEEYYDVSALYRYSFIPQSEYLKHGGLIASQKK